MEVVLCREDKCLALRDTLDLVRPLPRNLDGRLHGLSAGVHGQDHVVAEGVANLLGPDGEDVVVESSRAEGQAAGLLGQGLD